MKEIKDIVVMLAIGIILSFIFVAGGVYLSKYHLGFTLTMGIMITVIIFIIGVILLFYFRKKSMNRISHFTHNYVGLFDSTDKIIKSRLPNENIINKKNAYNFSFDILKIKRVPVGFGYWADYPLPIKLIETQHYYIIDQRLRKLINLVITGLIFVPLFYYLFPPEIKFVMPVSFLIVFLAQFFYSTITGLSQIALINKGWVLNKTETAHKLSLNVQIPENSRVTLSPDPFFRTGSFSIAYKVWYLIL